MIEELVIITLDQVTMKCSVFNLQRINKSRSVPKGLNFLKLDFDKLRGLVAEVNWTKKLCDLNAEKA